MDSKKVWEKREWKNIKSDQGFSDESRREGRLNGVFGGVSNSSYGIVYIDYK